jgi:hypothetical protein
VSAPLEQKDAANHAYDQSSGRWRASLLRGWWESMARRSSQIRRASPFSKEIRELINSPGLQQKTLEPNAARIINASMKDELQFRCMGGSVKVCAGNKLECAWPLGNGSAEWLEVSNLPDAQ